MTPTDAQLGEFAKEVHDRFGGFLDQCWLEVHGEMPDDSTVLFNAAMTELGYVSTDDTASVLRTILDQTETVRDVARYRLIRLGARP
jgi:hypothetical protein